MSKIILPSQASLAAASTYQEKIALFLVAANVINKQINESKNSPTNTFAFVRLLLLKDEILKDQNLLNGAKAGLLLQIVQVYQELVNFHPKSQNAIDSLNKKINQLNNGIPNGYNPRKRHLDFQPHNHDDGDAHPSASLQR